MLEVFGHILVVLQAVVVVDALGSWFVRPDQFPLRLTRQLTDPLYAPIRALLKPEAMGGFDLSPLLVLFLIQAMSRMLHGAG